MPAALPPVPKAKPFVPAQARLASATPAPPAIVRAAAPVEIKQVRRERRTARLRESRQAQLVRTPPHRLRGKGPAVMARAEGNRGRTARHAGNAADLDPFDCRVRKNKPPCFHALSARR
jgi:hypothetical protein